MRSPLPAKTSDNSRWKDRNWSQVCVTPLHLRCVKLLRRQAPGCRGFTETREIRKEAAQVGMWAEAATFLCFFHFSIHYSFRFPFFFLFVCVNVIIPIHTVCSATVSHICSHLGLSIFPPQALVIFDITNRDERREVSMVLFERGNEFFRDCKTDFANCNRLLSTMTACPWKHQILWNGALDQIFAKKKKTVFSFLVSCNGSLNTTGKK